MALCAVYGLIDPRTDSLRYVGQAVDVHRRLKHHWKPSQLARGTHVARWLAALRRQGHRPQLVVIEEVDAGQLYERECFWIDYFRTAGCDLTNLQDRGPGGRPRGWHHTEATKEKIRAARAMQPNPRLGTKHSDATRRLFSQQRKGRRLTEEWKQAISIGLRTKRYGRTIEGAQ